MGSSGCGVKRRRAGQLHTAWVVGVGVPPVARCGSSVGLMGFPVCGFAALVEGAAGAHEDGQLVVEVVAIPGGDPGAGLEAEHFPGVPEAGEAADGLAVLPPLVAPAVFAAK